MDNNEVEINEELYEQYFQKVKNILKMKPNYSMRQVCMATKVPRAYIDKFIEDGLLILNENGKMGEPGSEEKVEMDRRSQLIASFKEQLRVDAERKRGNMSSQLVRDLNERKKNSDDGRTK